MHPANAAGAQGPLGKKSSHQKQDGVCGQQIVRDGIALPKSNDDANEPDDRQTDTDHGRGDGEDVDANIFFEMLV